MLHCPANSAFMHILEKLPNSTNESTIVGQEEECPEKPIRMSVIDAMAVGQSPDKPKQIRTCWHLAYQLISRIFEKYGDSDEIRLIFDLYDIPTSLKHATCLKRQGQQDLINYRITPSTLITKVVMKKLLSHTSTKNELAKYLAEQTIEHVEKWSQSCSNLWRQMQGDQERHVVSEE